MKNVFEELVGPMSVGMLLKAYRVTNDLTQGQLEKKLKLKKGSLARIENGSKKLTLKETVRLAKKLDEYVDFYAFIWFQEEARDAGLDFHKYLRNNID